MGLFALRFVLKEDKEMTREILMSMCILMGLFVFYGLIRVIILVMGTYSSIALCIGSLKKK